MRERTIYLLVIAGLGALIVMLVGWNYDRQNAEADAKAAELISAYEAARLGLRIRTRSRGRSATTAARSIPQTASSCRATGSSDSSRAASTTSDRSGSTAGFARPVAGRRRLLSRAPRHRGLLRGWDFDDVVRD